MDWISGKKSFREYILPDMTRFLSPHWMKEIIEFECEYKHDFKNNTVSIHCCKHICEKVLNEEDLSKYHYQYISIIRDHLGEKEKSQVQELYTEMLEFFKKLANPIFKSKLCKSLQKKIGDDYVVKCITRKHLCKSGDDYVPYLRNEDIWRDSNNDPELLYEIPAWFLPLYKNIDINLNMERIVLLGICKCVKV